MQSVSVIVNDSLFWFTSAFCFLQCTALSEIGVIISIFECFSSLDGLASTEALFHS